MDRRKWGAGRTFCPLSTICRSLEMDPGLHVKQALNHLQKILAYYPYVEEDGAATVALTPEDWHVVADALFHMDTPRALIPDAITDYRMAEDGSVMLLTVEDGTRITVEVG